MLTKVLESCIGGANFDVKQLSGNINVAKYEFSLLSWCIPVFHSISLINDGRTSLQHHGVHERLEHSIWRYMVHSHIKINFLLFPGTLLTVLPLKNAPDSGPIS